MAQITYPYKDINDKTVVEYKYYPGTNLIKTVKSGNTNYAEISDYKADGKTGKIKFGNNLETSYSYYANSLSLKKISTGTSGSIMDSEYTYTSVGNIATRIDKGTNTYKYDPLSRLKSATNLSYPAKNASYTYNDIGNILTRTAGGKTYSYTYDSTRVHAVSKVRVDDTDHLYVYDNNGNLTSGPDLTPGKTGVRAFEYNQDNMPVKISLAPT